MTSFGAYKRDAARKPPHVTVLPPAAFADAWATRPVDDVAVGVRIPSDHDVSLARANAARLAWDLHPLEKDIETRTDAYNDALIRELCALSMCDPNDLGRPFFHSQEDDVRTKLTTDGAKRVFDEIAIARVATSPVQREATDDEILVLLDRLVGDERFDAVDPRRAGFVRRLLAIALDEIEAA